MSINVEHIHLAASGRLLHDIVGPMSAPKAGPTLLALLMAMVMALVVSIPISLKQKKAAMHDMPYKAKNTKSVACD